MKKLYEGSRAIMLFLLIVIICQTLGGDKFAQTMVLVILFSMIILNSEKFSATMLKLTKSI